MKILFLLALISFSAVAGEKGNGTDPLGQIDEEFVAQEAIICPTIVDEPVSKVNGYDEEPVKIVGSDGADRYYEKIVVKEYCCSMAFGPGCNSPRGI